MQRVSASFFFFHSFGFWYNSASLKRIKASFLLFFSSSSRSRPSSLPLLFSCLALSPRDRIHLLVLSFFFRVCFVHSFVVFIHRLTPLLLSFLRCDPCLLRR